MICWWFRKVNRQLEEIMATIADLQAQVEATKGVEESALVLIQGLHTKLDEALQSGDPAALQKAVDDLKASADSLAAGVAANPLP